ncbi:MAG TPA: leucine--tRNA ligase, partial [Nannocystis exedens]|nr:leucine--tRNA ligase [Nannocystis exedens]
ARRDESGDLVTFGPGDVDALGEGENLSFVVKATGESVRVQWEKMSKSRGNVINPDDVIHEYGADTMRLYEMFMGPLEHSAPWQPEGVSGCHRFLQRVYRLVFDDRGEGADVRRSLAPGEGSDRQRRLLHRTIEQVGERIERLSFNTAIAAMMIFVKEAGQLAEPLAHGVVEKFLILLAPFAPHLAEELWRELGNEESLAHAPWPTVDPALLVDETWTLVVQVNGKKRAQIEAPQGATKDELIALALGTKEIQRHLKDNTKTPRRVIYVPGKLINVVV